MIDVTTIKPRLDALDASTAAIRVATTAVAAQSEAVKIANASADVSLWALALPPPDVNVAIQGQGVVHLRYNRGPSMGWLKWGGKQRVPAVQPALPWRLNPTPIGADRLVVWADHRWDFDQDLYVAPPQVALNKGIPEQVFITHQGSIDSVAALKRIATLPLTGGVSGTACLSPYATGVGHGLSLGTPASPKGPAAILWLASTIYYYNWDGSSVAAAGRVPKDPLAPFDKSKPDDWYTWKGIFPDGYPTGILEGCDYPLDRKFVYLSDYLQGVVWQVDRHGTTDAALWTWTKFATGLTKPIAIRSLPNGRLFVVDQNGLHEIYVFTRQLNMLKPGTGMMFLRVNSKGELVVGDTTRKFVAINPITHAERVIHPGFGAVVTQWIGGDIAQHDYIVAKDTIVYVTGTSAAKPSANNSIFTLTDAGLLGDGAMFNTGGGNMPHGLASYTHEPLHYGWTVIIDPVLPVMYIGGFGNAGVHAIRRAVPEDKNYYDYNIYTAGEIYAMLTTGSAGGWPMGLRPSFTASWTPAFKSYTNMQADELAMLNDADFATFFRSTSIDGVARPEMGDLQLAYLRWWIDLCSQQRVYNNVAPRLPKLPPDKIPPGISAVSSTFIGNSLHIFFKTDKPAVCYAVQGQYAGRYTRCKIERDADYRVAHEIVFEDCLPSRSYYFQIGAQSIAGYLTRNKTMDYATNGTTIAVAPRSPKLRWLKEESVEVRAVQSLAMPDSLVLSTETYGEWNNLLTNPAKTLPFKSRRFVSGEVVHVISSPNGSRWRSSVVRADAVLTIARSVLAPLGAAPWAHGVEIIYVDDAMSDPPELLFPTCSAISV